MWLIELIYAHFSAEVPILPIVVFRLLFGLWCLIKFTTETYRGYFRYFDHETYLHVAYNARERFPLITTNLYRLIYILKIPAAAFLTVGWFVKPALVILALSFLIEIKVYFKFHTNLFLLCTVIMLLSPDLERALRLGQDSLNSSALLGDPLPQAMIVATMSIVYLSTAFRKLNPAFLSGTVVFGTIQHLLEHKAQRRFFDALLPELLMGFFFGASDRVLQKRWLPLMVATVALEFVLPFMLLSSKLWPLAAAVGVVMHVCFTFLSPATLLHFSLLSVSIYPLFLAPEVGAALLRSLFYGS